MCLAYIGADGGVPGSFIGNTRTIYDTTGGFLEDLELSVDCQTAGRAQISLEGAEWPGGAES